MKKILIAATVVWVALSGSVIAQTYSPEPGWKDSYSVDGVCYCDSNGFDHGADRLTYSTPAGVLPVTQICADISSVLGEGRLSGRIPYNDLQCGNGPPNEAGDEYPDACPGRVDIGPEGCQILGPKWDLAAVYGNTPATLATLPGPPAAPRLPTEPGITATASHNADRANLAIDNDWSTRWRTTQTQRPGQFFELDLGRPQTLNQVTLDSGNSQNEFPSAYSLFVSVDGRSYSRVASGSGSRGITTISFPVRTARYIRISQTGTKPDSWWSIHEMHTALMEIQTPSNPTEKTALDRSGWTLVTSSNVFRAYNAIDGKSYSRWATWLQTQNNNQFFEIDMQSARNFDQIVMDTSESPAFYPRAYRVLVSNDGGNFRIVASGRGNGAITSIVFSMQNARYVRIEQTGFHSEAWWSIHEINLYR